MKPPPTLYTFDQLKSNKVEPRRPLRKMVFNVPTRRELTSGERAIQHGRGGFRHQGSQRSRQHAAEHL